MPRKPGRLTASAARARAAKKKKRPRLALTASEAARRARKLRAELKKIESSFPAHFRKGTILRNLATKPRRRKTRRATRRADPRSVLRKSERR